MTYNVINFTENLKKRLGNFQKNIVVVKFTKVSKLTNHTVHLHPAERADRSLPDPHLVSAAGYVVWPYQMSNAVTRPRDTSRHYRP